MSKFCGNCGAQMEDNARICGMCGTLFENGGGPSAAFAHRQPNVNGIPGGAKIDGNLTIMHIGEALLFVLLGILTFVKLFSVDVLGFSEPLSLKELFRDAEAVPVILGILMFAAAVVTILPLLGVMAKKPLIFQIVISALAFLLLIITYIVETNSDEAVFYDFTLTAGGWFYLFICIINITLSVLISKKSK